MMNLQFYYFLGIKIKIYYGFSFLNNFTQFGIGICVEFHSCCISCGNSCDEIIKTGQYSSLLFHHAILCTLFNLI